MQPSTTTAAVAVNIYSFSDALTGPQTVVSFGVAFILVAVGILLIILSKRSAARS